MHEYVTLSIDIDRDAQALYDRLWRPEAFLQWASGLCGANLKPDGEAWTGAGMEGPLRVRFSPRNQFGVLDHYVSQAHEPEIYVPLRIVANGAGATVSLTLFRMKEVTKAMFDADIEWVKRDLETLKQWVAG